MAEEITLEKLFLLVKDNQEILKKLQAKSEQVDLLISKVNTLETKVEQLQKETKELLGNVNDREQYARSWSIRINGLSVSKEDEEKFGKDRAVMKKAYDKILKPILVAAKEEGALETVPASYYNLLENGHKLPFIKRPGASPSKPSGPPAIIVRFSSRFMRNTVLRHKKKHMPIPSIAEVAGGSSKYSIYEDLTKANFNLLRSLIGDTRFSKCWSVDGKIRFILDGDLSNRIHVVHSVHQSLDEIFNSSKITKK